MWWYLGLGIFIGGVIGVTVMSIKAAAKMTDIEDENARMRQMLDQY